MKRTTKLIVSVAVLFFSTMSVFAQLDPLPGDPLPGEEDPGIQVPLDGGLLIGLFVASGAVITLIKKRKKE